MQIKIYRYHGGKPREVASGLVELSYPPRITECRPLPGDDARMIDEIRGYIELILKNDLIPGTPGACRYVGARQASCWGADGQD